MTQRFDTKPAERQDPSSYLCKREGSRGSFKPSPASTQRQGSSSSSPRIAACHSATGCSKAATGTHFRRLYDRGDLPVRVDQCRPGHNTIKWVTEVLRVQLRMHEEGAPADRPARSAV